MFARAPQSQRRPSVDKLRSAPTRREGAPGRDGGRPLGEAERASHERAFGHDLSSVRIHTDAGAAKFTAHLAAQAVTIGNDIYFGPLAYVPGTPVGKRLLAHELAHVIQQRGGDGHPGGPVHPERAATRAADEASRDGIVRFGLRGAPVAPARQPQSWAAAVTAARAETDPARRRAAMLALLQRALPGRTVRLAGTSSPAAVDPADYQPTPTINFDEGLNAKQRWRSNQILSSEVGYTFQATMGGIQRAYSILGPRALDTGHEETGVQLYADHELFHATHPAAPTVSKADDEVAAWTDTFTQYFLRTYITRETWRPLIDYYEGASPGAQAASLTSLVTFVQGLSTAPAQPRSEHDRFVHWLRRRLQDPETQTKRLIVDLSAKLLITATAPSSSASSSGGSAVPPAHSGASGTP
ncbi:MAG: DUF4157 domain-containing protein [Streptosporangiaceae bacterium]